MTGLSRSELAAQVAALRDVLTAVRAAAVVPYPLLDLSDEGFDPAACDAAWQAFHDAQRSRAIQVQGAAEYALDSPHGVGSIRVAAKVLREQAARPLSYEPEPEAEAGQ